MQMAMLEPKLAILDETDSGLDIDALRTISEGINRLKRDDNAFVVITHYQRLLDYVKPDFVHIMRDGRIVKTGGPELALELEAIFHFCRQKKSAKNGVPSLAVLYPNNVPRVQEGSERSGRSERSERAEQCSEHFWACSGHLSLIHI